MASYRKFATSTFRQMSLMEISDIDLLVKALFKVNVDIAHRECFVKVNIAEPSDWWYGYVDGDRWISFEPTVEFKFSNLHSENQVHDGKLFCTVDSQVDRPTPRIAPVNRELLEDGGVQYSDLDYFYDYATHLRDVEQAKDADVESWESILTWLDDEQRHYDILPLHLHSDSAI